MCKSNLFKSALAATLVALIVGVTAVPASAVPLTRTSGNGCARANLNYDYISQGGGRYYIYLSGTLTWKEADGCGLFSNPYAGALQWSGKRNGVAFGWRVISNGYMTANPHYHELEGGGYSDIRFRMCNWHDTTGAVGTCGPS
jgi:hypothetical protein